MDLSFQAKPIIHSFVSTCAEGKSPQLVFIGYASDQGTARNNGRIGGERCVAMLRQLFKDQIRTQTKHIVLDLGDTNRDDYSSLQQTLEAHNQKLLTSMRGYPGSRFISLGGSNDQSYANAAALISHYGGKLAVINVDAHFDVRPLKEGKVHSGSPFRQMLQDQRFKGDFVEFGAKGYSCSQSHYEYLCEKGAQVIWMEKHIRRAKKILDTQAGSFFKTLLDRIKQPFIFLSFDVDSIDSRYMPGVSAPCVTGGLTADQALEIVSLAAKDPRVKLFDFSEGNPAVEKVRSMRLLGDLFKQLVESL